VLEVKLVGADTCNRYKRMREIVLDEVARANIEIALVEENEATGILKYRTVNLPMLFIGGEKIAQGNPPSRKKVQACLRAR
jgi:Thioredoxin domain